VVIDMKKAHCTDRQMGTTLEGISSPCILQSSKSARQTLVTARPRLPRAPSTQQLPRQTDQFDLYLLVYYAATNPVASHHPRLQSKSHLHHQSQSVSGYPGPHRRPQHASTESRLPGMCNAFLCLPEVRVCRGQDAHAYILPCWNEAPPLGVVLCLFSLRRFAFHPQSQTVLNLGA